MFGKPNVGKLKEKKEYEKLAQLLTHKDKALRLESAKALMDAILAPALGNEHSRKYEIARMFNNATDGDILNMLVEQAGKYGSTGTPEQAPLIQAILFAHGFDQLVELLARRGKGNLAGDWFQSCLTTELFSYATQMRLGTDVFVKIIPNAKCQFSDAYLDAVQYFRTLPGIKLSGARIEEIRNLIDQRKKETERDQNVVVQGNNRMDELLFEKITAE